MAEAAPIKTRWTDHWQVKTMIGGYVLVGGLVTSGASWMVGKVMANEADNLRQDAKIESNERARLAAESGSKAGIEVIINDLKEIKADIKELRKGQK